MSVRWLSMAWIGAVVLLLTLAGLSGRILWTQGIAARDAAVEAERDARLRLALWRMDAWLVPRLTAEQSRLATTNPITGGLPTITIWNQEPQAAPPELQVWLTDMPLPDVPDAPQQTAPGNDLESRIDYAQSAYSIQSNANLIQPTPQPLRQAPAFLPHWQNERLFLLRRAPEDVSHVEVLLVDFHALSNDLRALAVDLLPNLIIKPHLADDHSNTRLAAMPLSVDPGPALPGFTPPALPVGATVALTGGLLLAALALAGLAAGSLRLARRRSDFVAAVTHELRTPLTTLRLYTDLLEQGLISDDQRGEYLTTVRQEADHLAALVENVLAFAGLEGRHHDPITGDVRPTLQQLLPQLQQRVEQAGGTCTHDLPTSLPAVTYDPAALEHVLANLVDNALKYAAPATIAISIHGMPNGLAIHCRDHGPGLPGDHANQWFRPFKRGSHTTGERGIGLGLSLCKTLVGGMRGNLRYEAADPGARFIIELRHA